MDENLLAGIFVGRGPGTPPRVDAVAEAYDGGPVAALRRIGFLLERGREDTYKVKAFRDAAAAILPLADDEVRARVEDGTLTKLAGVGASTAKVIAAAIDGEMPERLAALEKEHGGPLTKGGHELRGQLRGDLHSHSDWSDGGSPIEEMAFTAIELGHDYQVLTDHSPRLRVANGLSVERLKKQLGVVDAINAHLRGRLHAAQGDRGRHPRRRQPRPDRGDARPARPPGRQRALQAGHGRAGPMTRRMVAAVRNPLINVLGHCTGRMVMGARGTRKQSQFDAKAVFERLRGGNTSPSRSTPGPSVATRRPSSSSSRATSAACSRSTPTRTPRASSTSSGTAPSAPRRPGIDPDRIVNTWPKERLLEWANG